MSPTANACSDRLRQEQRSVEEEGKTMTTTVVDRDVSAGNEALIVDRRLVERLNSAESPEECVAVVRELQRRTASTDGPTTKRPSAEQYVNFLRYGYEIKETERRGWRRLGIEGGETVACHMYRMALMAMVMEWPGLDMRRCTEMCLVHDLAEAIVGDITPDCGVAVEEKHRREREAMGRIVSTMASTSEAEKILSLWQEYEENETEEAHFVHELDKLEMALQAVEYEQKHARRLDVFVNAAHGKISHPLLRKIMDLLLVQRSAQERP